MNPRETWIGLVEVEPEPGNAALEDAAGAYVNVVALALDEEDFVALARTAMSEHGLQIVAMKDVMPFKLWQMQHQPHPEIAHLANNLTPEYPIQFDEFQAYPSEDEEPAQST